MPDHQNLLDKMRSITKELMANGPQSATALIQQALRDAGLASAHVNQDEVPPVASTHDKPSMRDINAPPAARAAARPASASVNGPVEADQAGYNAGAQPELQAQPKNSPRSAGRARRASAAWKSGSGKVVDNMKKNGVNDQLGDLIPDLLSKLGAGAAKVRPASDGGMIPEAAQFIAGNYANAAGMRQYRLYVPACYDGQPLPLVVMLHGCTQDPEDFARGTQMNAAAERHRCLVLYPQQSKSANSSKCWNWFNANDQQRDSGEPSILAGMTRDIAARYAVDPQQIYIAGLSAGGAMAAIMGTVYPDLYAGVGVHSGLPYGAATDLPSALAAMRSGLVGPAPAVKSSPGQPAFKGIPIIVFHGDADHTVNVRNGIQVMTNSAIAAPDKSRQIRSEGRVAGGHAYTRTIQNDAVGNTVAEHWLVHGFGHAWAGGSPSGSFTDARGPDATQEMMRFFYTQKKVA